MTNAKKNNVQRLTLISQVENVMQQAEMRLCISTANEELYYRDYEMRYYTQNCIMYYKGFQ